MATDPALELATLAVKAMRAYGRDDLATRLDGARTRHGDHRAVVAVVGEFKQGKSSLVNALAGADACPVDDDVATVVPTVVGYAPVATARAVTRRGEQHDIPVDELSDWAAERGNAGNIKELSRVEIGLPSSLLERGLLLIDTAGAGGLGSSHGALTMAMLPLVDAVMFVSGITQELTRPEMEYLRAVHDFGHPVLLVATKVDLQPHWRELVDVDRAHLAAAGLGVAVVPVSSELFFAAAATTDVARGEALIDESGVPDLVGWLLDQVAVTTQRASTAGLAAEIIDAVTQVRGQLAAERDGLASPDDAVELLGGLERAKAAAEQARSAASKWSQAMVDAFGDLNAAVDNDLRDHLRVLSSEMDELVEHTDPVRGWGAIERELHRRAALVTAEHCTTRLGLISTAVSNVDAVFEAEHATAGDWLGGLAELRVALPATVTAPTIDKHGIFGQGLTLIRGSYGGLTMLGFLGGFTGIALATPVVTGIGVLLGGRGLKDERKRLQAQRRAQVRSCVRKYIDDLSIALTREGRDTMRHLHRAVRDHYSTRADEQQRSTAESAAAARRAIELAQSDRTGRIADLDAELRRVDQLLAKAATLRQDVA